jgi:hypothetical protein
MTVNIWMDSVKEVLVDMGFTGKVLDDMGAIVKDRRDLEELEAFIVNNEDTLTTNLSILNSFRRMKIEQDEISLSDFVTNYELSVCVTEKQKCLETLLKGNIDIRWVEDLDKKIHKGDTTLADFYRAFTEQPNLHIRKLAIEAVCLTQGLDW